MWKPFISNRTASGRNSSPPPTLLGMGMPILEGSGKPNQQLLNQYDFTGNAAFVTDDEHIFEAMENQLDDFYASGATQNTIRVAKWLLAQKAATAYLGCVGNDAAAIKLREKAREAGVNVQYQINENYPTGRCAVLIASQGRIRVTKLDATAISYNESHLLANWETVKAANVVYSAGFFLEKSLKSMLKVSKHCAEFNKTYCVNLSSDRIVNFCRFEKILPYTDIVFGNQKEAFEFAKVFFPNVQVKDVEDCAKRIARMNKNNGSKGRIVIITQGPDPVIVVEQGKIKTFDVRALTDAEKVDFNGAGDAFVGGFLAQYVQDKPLETAVRCGIWAAQHVIKRYGCTYDKDSRFEEI